MILIKSLTFGKRLFKILNSKFLFCHSYFGLLAEIRQIKQFLPYSIKTVSIWNSKTIQYENESSEEYNQFDFIPLDEMHRTFLYENCNDKIMHNIYCSRSVKELFSHLYDHPDFTPSIHHISQAVVTLWDMKKILSFIDFKTSLKFKKEILLNPKLMMLLSTIEEQYLNIPINILPFVLLSLRRIGININESVMQNLLNEAWKNYYLFTLQALSCCSVAIENIGHKNIPLMSLLINHLVFLSKNVTTEEEVKCIAISIIHLRKLLSDSFIVEYARKVEEIMKTVTLSNNVIIKCLLALSLPKDQLKYINTMQNLVNLLSDKALLIDITQLTAISKIVKRGHCNFDNLSKIIQVRAIHLLQGDISIHNRISILHSLSFFPEIKDKEIIEEKIFEALELIPFDIYSAMIADIIINLPITNVDKLNILWEKFSDDVQYFKNPLRICQYYLLYRQKITNYRHYKFEKIYIQWCKQYLDNTECIFTKKFSICFAFILACEGFQISRKMLDKLLELSPQFKSLDILLIAIALHLNYYENKNLIIIDDIKAKLNNVILSKISRGTLSDLNKLISAEKLLYSDFNFLYSIPIEECLNKYSYFIKDFSLKNVLHITQNLTYCRYLLPDVIDAMTKLLLKNSNCLNFKTFSNLMHCYYDLGYCPDFENLFDTCNELLLEYSKTEVNCLLMLQSALTLALFQHLKQELIHRIFSISFMDKLDLEISGLSFNYVSKVRNLLMKLNRAVCLDNPEETIPWFHEKYCWYMADKTIHKMTPFKKEIYDVLCSLLTGSEYVEDHIYTPYYYCIDFECQLDKNKKPIPYSKQEIFKPKVNHHSLSSAHQKIAINSLSKEVFCVNIPKLCGDEIMKKRHLEILGYKVVEVPYFEWNSMKLSSRSAKLNYLYKKIFDF